MKIRWYISIVLIILSIAGIYFIGTALNGFVISESCCFGENCKTENLCDSAKPHIEQPAQFNHSNGLIIAYIILSLTILIALMYILIEKNND